MKVFIFFILVGLSLCDESSPDPDCVTNSLKDILLNNASNLINRTCELMNSNTDENMKIFISEVEKLTNCAINQTQVNASDLQQTIDQSLLAKFGVNTTALCNMVKGMNSQECVEAFGNELKLFAEEHCSCFVTDKIDPAVEESIEKILKAGEENLECILKKSGQVTVAKRSIGNLWKVVDSTAKVVDSTAKVANCTAMLPNFVEIATECINRGTKKLKDTVEKLKDTVKNITGTVKDLLSNQSCCNKESGLTKFLYKGANITIQDIKDTRECGLIDLAGLEKKQLNDLYDILDKLLKKSWEALKSNYSAVCSVVKIGDKAV